MTPVLRVQWSLGYWNWFEFWPSFLWSGQKKQCTFVKFLSSRYFPWGTRDDMNKSQEPNMNEILWYSGSAKKRFTNINARQKETSINESYGFMLRHFPTSFPIQAAMLLMTMLETHVVPLLFYCFRLPSLSCFRQDQHIFSANFLHWVWGKIVPWLFSPQ